MELAVFHTSRLSLFLHPGDLQTGAVGFMKALWNLAARSSCLKVEGKVFQFQVKTSLICTVWL